MLVFFFNIYSLMDGVICNLSFVRQPVQKASGLRQAQGEWMKHKRLKMTGAYWNVHSPTVEGGWGGQNKTGELIARSGMVQRKIDDLMEVWRQWAGRRGIWEAGGEGQDEIRHDGKWTPTLHVSAWQVIKAGQKNRQNGFTNCARCRQKQFASS